MEVAQVLWSTRDDKGSRASAKNGWGGLCSQFFLGEGDDADFASDCSGELHRKFRFLPNPRHSIRFDIEFIGWKGSP
jgi:hypothetical protein